MASGHCLCRQFTFETDGEPRWVAYCHCASCRRHTASPVRFSGERATYASSPGVTRSFCSTCGTPIGYETDKRPGEIDLYLNVFDHPEAFSPQRHVYYAEHIPWFDVRDELPRE